MFSETRFSSEILAAVFTLKWFLSTMYFHVIFKITWKDKNEATFVTRLLQTLQSSHPSISFILVLILPTQ